MTDTPQRLAIFDFDGTMAPGDSIVYLLRYAWKKGKLRPRDIPLLLPAAILGNVEKTVERGKSLALRFMRRINQEDQQAFFTDFVQHDLLPRLYPAAIKRMMQHRAQGDLILIVSASTDCYMALLKNFLPVHAVLSTPVDALGRVTHNCRGPEKVRRVQAWLKENGVEADFANSCAYGDSPSDAYVGRLTGNPVCVNAKKELIRRNPDWQQEDWRP